LPESNKRVRDFALTNANAHIHARHCAALSNACDQAKVAFRRATVWLKFISE